MLGGWGVFAIRSLGEGICSVLGSRTTSTNSILRVSVGQCLQLLFAQLLVSYLCRWTMPKALLSELCRLATLSPTNMEPGKGPITEESSL